YDVRRERREESFVCLCLCYVKYDGECKTDVHVKMFQAAIKANGKTSEKYIIN
ncbi:unnamed protein product, partial [Sphagnum troendelagicum]